MQRLNFKSFILLLITLLVSSTVCVSNTVEDNLLLARQFYINQEYNNAIHYFELYLNSTAYHPALASQVVEASRAHKGLNTQVEFVRRYLSKMPTLKQRSELYTHLAQLLEHEQRYVESIAYYMRAYEASRPVDDRLYYRAALLSLEIGEYARVAYMARLLWQRSDDVTLKNSILTIWLRALLLDSQGDVLREVLRKEQEFIAALAQPVLLYTLYQVYRDLAEVSVAQEFRAKLLAMYPHSLEALLVQGQVKQMLTPSLLWG